MLVELKVYLVKTEAKITELSDRNSIQTFLQLDFETCKSQVKQQLDQVHKENTLDQLVSWLTMKSVKKLTKKDGL